MAAPADIHNAFVDQIRKAFDAACPNLPMCRQRVAQVFQEMKDAAGEKDEEPDLFRLAMLAYDLGLEITFTLKAKS